MPRTYRAPLPGIYTNTFDIEVLDVGEVGGHLRQEGVEGEGSAEGHDGAGPHRWRGQHRSPGDRHSLKDVQFYCI